eukprot:5758835-Lingulodinium_polyedra.AAC.1
MLDDPTLDQPSLEFKPWQRAIADGGQACFNTFARRIKQHFVSARSASSRPTRTSPGAGPLNPEFDFE